MVLWSIIFSITGIAGNKTLSPSNKNKTQFVTTSKIKRNIAAIGIKIKIKIEIKKSSSPFISEKIQNSTLTGKITGLIKTLNNHITLHKSK